MSQKSEFSSWLRSLAPIQLLMLGGVVVGFLSLLAWTSDWCEWWTILIALAILAAVVGAIFGVNKLLHAGQTASEDELRAGLARSAVSEKFEDAVRTLKADGLSIYGLPWFLVIGEPDSGKTFAIKRSELKFVHKKAISGSGGTRGCDFWFSHSGIIVDTAGRLTVQNQDPVVDQEQWDEVLRLLKKTRPNCPIHGVILGIPCSSLIDDDEETRKRKASTLATRLKELQVELGIRFPIHIAILKTDLVFGFEPFFKRLPVKEHRHKQLFGWSNDAPFDQSFDLERFSGAFQYVVGQLRAWRLRFLSEEQSDETIDALFPFPDEFADLEGPLQDYVEGIFDQGPFGQPGFFRGFFFTSSVQAGQAVPRAIESLLSAVGKPPPQDTDDILEARSTPFFMRDLFEKKICAEQGLVLRTDRSRFSNALIRLSSVWGGAAVLVLGLVLIIVRVYLVGDTLKNPGNLVKIVANQAITSNTPFDVAQSLGDQIAKWEPDSGGFFSGFFLPSPETDSALITDLKKAYCYQFRERVLGPFFAAVEVKISQPTSWSSYIAERDALVALVELRRDRNDDADGGRVFTKAFARLLELHGELGPKPTES
ncbi:MAG: hypothetical protein GY946_24285, partial [bacterium]|nr:hypothetical protein [bacterium]